MGLKLQIKKEGQVIIISVEGALDAHSAPTFEKQVNDYLQKDKGNLILDFNNVNHIASAGFGALMPIKNIQDERGHKMVLANMVGNVKKVFKLLGFDNVLKAYSTIDEAKKAL